MVIPNEIISETDRIINKIEQSLINSHHPFENCGWYMNASRDRLKTKNSSILKQIGLICTIVIGEGMVQF